MAQFRAHPFPSQEHSATYRIGDIEKVYFVAGRHVENHGVIHNNWFNVTTQEKKQYYMTQFVDEYWDNGSLPIWITAQRQVHHKPQTINSLTLKLVEQ